MSSFMTAREAALVLYTSLSGEAEAELEHVPVESINCEGGIDFIMECLKTPMEQKAISKSGNFLVNLKAYNANPMRGSNLSPIAIADAKGIFVP